MEVEKGEKPKVEKPGMEEKRGRRGMGHTPEEKCRAVLSVWTERRKPGEVCRELGVALSPRLAVLLKKSQAGIMKGLDKRLKKLQGNPKAPQELREIAVEKKI
jgi:hypothetical protein